MAKLNKAQIDADLRSKVFEDIFSQSFQLGEYVKINDRQYGVLLYDANGVQRYVRIGAIVAEEREDETASEYMERERNLYLTTQANNAKKAQERAEKAKADKAKREAKLREKMEKAQAKAQ